MMFEIFDNILTIEEQKKIYNCFLDKKFPYFYLNYSVDKNIFNLSKNIKNIKENHIFNHTFYNDEKKISDNFHLVDYLFKQFINKTNKKFNKILRCRLNIQHKQNKKYKNCFNTPHIDFDKKHMVLLYYPITSDGDTLIFDKDFKIIKKIKPLEGRFFLFDGQYYHSGGVPVKNDIRMVLNFNII